MIKKSEWVLILFNLLYIVAFTIYYVAKQNYEFMVYIGVLVLLFALVFAIQKRVKFPILILWMLSVWGLLHMLGGGVHLADGTVLYRWIPIELYQGIDSEFVLLKFDQILHFYIYFVMSFVLAHLVRNKMRGMKPIYAGIFVALASMGLSVINELIEFGAVLFLGKTGVGGYYNTLLDLLFNTIGAVVGAWVSLLIKRH